MRVVILGILAIAALPAQDAAVDWVKSGNDLYAAGKYRDAAEAYEHDLSEHPRHKFALYGWAGTVLAEISPDLATARTAVNLKPDDPGPLPVSDIKQALLTKYGTAIEQGIKRLRYAIQLDPIYFDAMARLNELLRARASLRDTADQYQTDIAEVRSWDRKIGEAKAVKAAQPLERVRVGGNVQLANLLRKPLPSCPGKVRVTSTVELTVVIAKNGEIQDIQVLSGDPRVVPPVVAAVNDWIYKPTLLNNVPVEVITRIDVNMNCGGR